MSHESPGACDLDLGFEPERLADGRIAFDVEGVRVTLTPRGTGWDYDRPGLGRPVHVSGVEGQLPRFLARLAADEAVARFVNPVFVPASGVIELWVTWPLEVLVIVGDGAQVDRLTPGRRQTLFGTVNDGRVLPAAISEALAGPDDPAMAGRPIAALAVRIRNRSEKPATVARVPVFGGALTLHRKGASFAAGGVRTEVADDGHAEATTKPGDAPPGFALVAPAREAGQGSHLGWLLDATKRSVEFPL